tara:strand:+ start:61 stop:429 length:369 start_codon:yes stop_codon:yes gene_type:complete
MYTSFDEAMKAFEPENNERVALLNTTKGILVLSKSNGVPSHQWTMNFYFHCFGTEGIVDPHWTVSGDVQGGSLVHVLEWLNRRFGNESSTEEEENLAAVVAASKAHCLALKMDKLLKPQPTK